MVENRIRVLLAERNMSAAALANSVPDMDKVCMSHIMKGRAMPTREGMTAMCGLLDCKATDLYDEAELNLNVTAGRKSAGTQAASAKSEADINPFFTLEGPVRQKAEETDTSGHKGQVRLFFWFRPEEKTALVKAIRGLGYRSTAEWMREMYRQTLKQYASLGLDGKALHELVPPFGAPASPATNQS